VSRELSSCSIQRVFQPRLPRSPSRPMPHLEQSRDATLPELIPEPPDAGWAVAELFRHFAHAAAVGHGHYHLGFPNLEFRPNRAISDFFQHGHIGGVEKEWFERPTWVANAGGQRSSCIVHEIPRIQGLPEQFSAGSGGQLAFWLRETLLRSCSRTSAFKYWSCNELASKSCQNAIFKNAN